MKRGALAGALLIVALVPALGGCVEYRETLVVERDGGGTATLEVGIGETLAKLAELARKRGFDRTRVVTAIESTAGLHVEHSAETQRDGSRWLSVRVRFDSIADLARLDALEGYRGLFGGIALSEDGNRELQLVRHPGIDRERAGSIAPAAALLGPVLTGYQWRFEARLPTRIADASGPGAAITDSRHVVTWKVALADVLDHPPTLEVRYARPGPGPLGIAVGAALMLACAAIALVFVRRRRRARSQTDAATPR